MSQPKIPQKTPHKGSTAMPHQLTIEFISDWRIGSGTGRPGDVDQLIRRDAQGLPFVPAKTLVGLWRDGCERVAQALDHSCTAQTGTGTHWMSWVEWLFGNHPSHPDSDPGHTPTPAHLRVQSAHFPEAFCKAIQHKPALLAALTFVQPAIKIDDHTGSVDERCFRLTEMARGGITLAAEVTIETSTTLDPLQQDTVNALLTAGATLVDHMGGKRRRGAGKCRLQLGFSIVKAHQFLSKHEHPPVAPPPESIANAPENSAGQAAERVICNPETGEPEPSWYRLPLILTAQQPVIVTHRTVGNVVESLDYIPGGNLLPIVARRLRKLGVNVGEAIANSQIVVTNALPTQGKAASAPVPFALFYEKQSQGAANTRQQAYNRLLTKPAGGQLKQFRSGYLTHHESQSPQLVTVATGIETHNTVSDSKQRPDKASGGVYSYEAIPAGTELRAELRLGPALVETLQQKSSDWQTEFVGKETIGRSKKDEYGLVSIEVLELEAIATTPDPDAGPDTASAISKLTLWLLSDVLLRDEWLSPTTDLQVLIREVETKLDLSAGTLKLAEFTTDTCPLFARQRRGESWQTRWGLPRPSLVGLSAGSCLRLQVQEGETITPQAIRQLEIQGVGERCAEGYGQIKLNVALLEQEEIQIATSDTATSDVETSKFKQAKSHWLPQDDSTFDYARQVETVAWEGAIQRAAIARAAEKAFREDTLGFSIIKSSDSPARSSPSLSQLGSLRTQLIQWSRSSGSECLIGWLEALEKQEKWPKDTLSKVRGLIQDAEQVWKLLSFETQLQLSPHTLCCTNAGKKELRSTLWKQAVETLISEGIRAHKREVEQPSKSQQPTSKTGGQP